MKSRNVIEIDSWRTAGQTDVTDINTEAVVLYTENNHLTDSTVLAVMSV